MNDDFGSLRDLRELTRDWLGSHREKRSRIRSNGSQVTAARSRTKLSGHSQSSLP